MTLTFLGIESSCDDSAAAVVQDDGIIRSSVVSGQQALHAAFGGVVPEIAARAHAGVVSPPRRVFCDVGEVPHGCSGARNRQRRGA